MTKNGNSSKNQNPPHPPNSFDIPKETPESVTEAAAGSVFTFSANYLWTTSFEYSRSTPHFSGMLISFLLLITHSTVVCRWAISLQAYWGSGLIVGFSSARIYSHFHPKKRWFNLHHSSGSPGGCDIIDRLRDERGCSQLIVTSPRTRPLWCGQAFAAAACA